MDEFNKIKTAQFLIKDLCSYIHEQLELTEHATIGFVHSIRNAEDPLGKTAFYDPDIKKVSVFITGRHIKDIMRSLAHELVHHLQNCRGDLHDHQRFEGYAQTDDHLREMEREAYEKGNMLFRDWSDNIISGKRIIKENFNG